MDVVQNAQKYRTRAYDVVTRTPYWYEFLTDRTEVPGTGK